MVGNGTTGREAVDEWVAPRQAEVERIRAAIHEIAGSGLTLSKLVGGGEFAGGFGEGVIRVMPREDAASSSSSKFEALDRPPSQGR